MSHKTGGSTPVKIAEKEWLPARTYASVLNVGKQNPNKDTSFVLML